MRPILVSFALLAEIACATPAPKKPTITPGAAALGIEPHPGEIVAEYDLAHDGKPDLWKYSVRDPTGREILVRKEKDLNGDGKVDTWELYEPDGSLSRVVHDLDFDGKPDVALFYERDQLVRKELAFGFDGLPRAWTYYEKGKLVRKERDTNGDGKVDTWEYWENGELDRIGVDVDGDGQVDRWEARRAAGAVDGRAAPSQPAQK
jgi:hypothetical protein